MFDRTKMAAQAVKLQKQLKKEIISVEAGDGAVTVEINAKMDVRSVKLDEDKIKDVNNKQLEEWIQKAMDQAIKKSQMVMAEKMQAMGGLNFPGM